jgi:hypothetical protein
MASMSGADARLLRTMLFLAYELGIDASSEEDVTWNR